MSSPDFDVTLAIAAIDGLDRPGEADPERDARWRAMRKLPNAACVGGEFDPRRILDMSAVEREAWKDARRVWALAILRESEGTNGAE